MSAAPRYEEVIARRGEIMKRSLGLDYQQYEREGGIAFDYEALAGSLKGPATQFH